MRLLVRVISRRERIDKQTGDESRDRGANMKDARSRAPMNAARTPKNRSLLSLRSLGMSHDVPWENGCYGIVHHADGYVETTVMHPGNMYVTKKWSECSRHYLNIYIE